MFSKKKSLAKIAKVRSKKEANVQTEEEENDDKMSLDVPLTRQSSVSTPNLAEASSSSSPPTTPVTHNRPSLLNPLLSSLGSLHGSDHHPHSFDHDFDGQKVSMAQCLLHRHSKDYSAETSSSAVASAARNPLHSPRRTQSVRVATPIVKVQDEDGVERSQRVLRGATAMSPPMRIPQRTRSARYIRRRTSDNPSSSYPSPAVPNPNHVSPTSSSPSVSDDSDAEEDNYYEDQDTSVYCTPPKGLDPYLRGRKESVSKSRSMNSLVSSGVGESGQLDPLGLTLAAVSSVCAQQARTRSYLLGSVGATSLLGPQELEKCFPDDRTLRLFVGTWNMNGKAPPRHLADFLLPRDVEFVPDILVVATQESFPERNEWEVRLQDTLGPSHVLFHSGGMGTLHMAVFLRRDLIWYCSTPETDSFNARPGTQFRTKGAVAVAFLLFGTSFLFVNSHLTAHEENTKDRIRDYRKISAMLNLPRELPTRSARHKEISEKFDCVFWCGDLNFRLAQSREVVIQEVAAAEGGEGSHHGHHGGGHGGSHGGGTPILEFDQLNYLRREGLIFKGYSESEINFPPTYKYDVGSDRFDTSSKQRTPSYTDRILYKSQRSTVVRPVYYDSVRGVTTSDHRPVWGMWEVRLRPGRDTVPLAGGLFNREVYLDGLKRRVEALQPVIAGKDSNYSCSVQ